LGETSIKLAALDGRWEEVGRDRFPGIYPEAVNVQSDPGGFAAITFQLQRPRIWQPSTDLKAWTPCLADEGSKRLFEGRVRETPIGGDAGVISVAGRGYQYALDDNSVEPVYVHSDMSAWVDYRSIPTADLSKFGSSAQADVAAGQIILAFASDNQVGSTQAAGVTLDLGEENEARSISFDWDNLPGLTGAGILRLYVRSHDTPGGAHPVLGGWQEAIPGDFVDIGAVTATPRHYFWNGPDFHRYVTVFIYRSTSFTPTADTGIRITGLRVFTGRSGSASSGSFFRASDLVADAFRQAGEFQVPDDQEPEDFADEVLAADPSGWWRFVDTADELGGVFAVGGALNQSPGPLASGEPSVYADVTGDSIEIPGASPGGLASFTVAILFRTTQAIGGQVATWDLGAGLVSRYVTGTANDWGIALGGGVPHAGVGNPNQTIQSFDPVNDGEWHLVTFARDMHSGRIRLDVDGVEVASLDATNKSGLDGAGNTVVGQHAAVAGSEFDGDVAELVFFDRYLPPEFSARLWEAARSRPRSTIRRTLTELPHMAAAERRNSRELVDAAQALHRYRCKVIRDRVPLFGPFPSVPKWVVGEAAENFQDASANAGDEIYNVVDVIGTGTDGRPLRVRRVSPVVRATVQHNNPSFTTDDVDWFEGPGTIARSVAHFKSAPASGLVTVGTGAAATLVLPADTWTSPPRVGHPYTLRLTLGKTGEFSQLQVGSEGLNGPVFMRVNAADLPYVVGVADDATTFRTFEASFTFDEDQALTLVVWAIGASQPALYIDDLELLEGATILDRHSPPLQRVYRLSIGFPITEGIARVLGDAFLYLHRNTPLRGTIPIGPGDLFDTKGNQVHPRELVNEEGELLRFASFIDPDTGDLGRHGAIAAVTYDPATEVAGVTVDNQRDNFQALLERLGAIGGPGG
jgi:hypothetical protein